MVPFQSFYLLCSSVPVSVPLNKGNPSCDGNFYRWKIKHRMGCSFVSIPNEICNIILKRITGFPFRLLVLAYWLFYWFNILAPYWLLPRKDFEKEKGTRLLPAICMSCL
jgi:hypothetical protein